MIDLKQASEAMEMWQRTCFPELVEQPEAQLLSRAGKVAEEAAEVLGAAIKSLHSTARHAAFTLDNIEKEAGDVLVSVLVLCKHLNLDPEEVLRRRWEKVRRRGDIVPGRTMCECGHHDVHHRRPSSFPIGCAIAGCECPSFALPGTALADDSRADCKETRDALGE